MDIDKLTKDQLKEKINYQRNNRDKFLRPDLRTAKVECPFCDGKGEWHEYEIGDLKCTICEGRGYGKVFL